MALVDSSGRAVRSGTTGRAINSGSSRGNNNNNNNGGNGRAANRARSSANLAAAKAASKASAVETQRRNQDGQSQIKAAEAQALAQQQAVQQAAANRKMQEQIAAAEKQAQAQALAQQKAAQQQQQNQQGIAAYKAMMEGPVVAGNPNVVGNTYANAPTQFTEGRSGTSYYPANAPDTVFRGLMGNLTGSGLLSGAADMVGEDNPVGGFLKAYSEFDPLGDFAQQTVYGMNDVAKQEYMRQEASNPNWPTMSEKEKVQLARKPQMDNQLPHAFINDGISNTANEAQLNAMRPFIKDSNMSEAQFNRLPIEMRRQLTKDVNPNNLIIGSANQGDNNPFIPPVEEVAPESYTSYMADYSPMFSFAGKSGLSSFAEGGEVESQGVGRLFEDMNRAAPMDPILEHHYKNLAQGKAVQNENGTVSTVYTSQVDVDGIPTLIPTVWDGQILSDEAATQRSIATGIQWPTASTHEELREYDNKLHENMQNMPAEAAQMMLMQQ